MSKLTIGTRVRFVADSRNGDWRKGQFATIDRVLALPPQNQRSLYILSFKELLGVRRVWATDQDIVPDEQMTIFDVLPTTEASSGN
jgi:hypothetical protein